LHAAHAAKHLQQTLAACIDGCHEDCDTQSQSPVEGACQVIAEADGVMVPIVYTDAPETAESQGAEQTHLCIDKRKARRVCWKEARTAAVCGVDRPQWQHIATFSNPEGFLNGSRLAASNVGYAAGQKVHVITDGATWIQEWAEGVFGADAEPTIDMYHLLEYASEAGLELDKRENKQDIWKPVLMDACRAGDAEQIAAELKRRQDYKVDQESAIFRFVRYVENRPGMFAYDKIRRAGLPVGSGKIESTNRQLVQQRMKLPGAWWHPDTVDPALHLLTFWHNDRWDQLWEYIREQAA
jgi:hypothetical protein